MGKNKRRTFPVFDKKHNINLDVDSQEEQEFVVWLNTACDMGLINDFEYQPKSLKLSDAVSYIDCDGKTRSLFREHVYTPDFLLYVNGDSGKLLMKEFKMYETVKSRPDKNIFAYYIDVKGTFASNDGGRSFSINQKWIYSKLGVYIYKLVPKDFFKKFGIVEELRYTPKTKKLSKKYEGYSLISEIF